MSIHLRKIQIDDRDLWSGAVFVAIGVAGLVLGADLNVGTAADMGEGYVPRAMAIALVALGTLTIILAWRRVYPPPQSSPARGEDGPVQSPPQSSPARGDDRLVRWRPLVFVTAAVLAFVAALETLGLIAAIACSVAAANFAGQPLRARSLAILICALSAVVVAVFVWGLGLPLHVLP
jgi:putative tricarboxylic transport membrane protein